MPILDWQIISSALGYSSIVAWLFAQLPQLIENYRNGSVEGLALPFLVSWLAGDALNLIGCLLTHQLPFQTYLATYFVLVDVGLMSQYIYYARKHPIPDIPPLAHSSHRSYIRSESWVAERNRSRRRRARRSGTDGGDPLERSWMSESSAHSPASSRPHGQSLRTQETDESLPSTASSTEPPSPDLSVRGRTLARPPPRDVFGPLKAARGGVEPTEGTPMGLGLSDGVEDEWVGSRRQSASTSRSRPPTSGRRTSSMVFLSVGILVGFGRWRLAGEGVRETGVGVGKAWSTGRAPGSVSLVGSGREWSGSNWGELGLHHPVFFTSTLTPSERRTLPRRRHLKRQTFPIDVSFAPSPSTLDAPEEGPGDDDGDDDYPYPKRDFERFLGRASAWVCTTLYLTSRLPQIWQNFRRRSVEGLSMMLFVMAFVGNTLYVLSILTNPLTSQPGYLLESSPYLLGSGGTLLFDITIVLQSFLYSEKRKLRQEHARRLRGKHGVDAEEAAALLDGHDATSEDGEATTDDDQTTTGRRSPSASKSRERSRSSRRGVSRRPSDSTELAVKYLSSPVGYSSSPYRHEHGVGDAAARLEERDFEFGRQPGGSGSGSGRRTLKGSEGEPQDSRSISRGGRARTTSAQPDVPPIAEESESSVTLRA